MTTAFLKISNNVSKYSEIMEINESMEQKEKSIQIQKKNLRRQAK